MGKSDHRRLCTFRIGSGKKQKKKNNLEESGPLRLAKTVFELDKHPFRDVNDKIGINFMFEIRWYDMPAVRLNMEITSK